MIEMKQLETKIQGAKKQVQETKKKGESAAGLPKLRAIQKRLRRLQRKRRVVLARQLKLTKKEAPKAQAAAEKPAEAAPAEAAPAE